MVKEWELMIMSFLKIVYIPQLLNVCYSLHVYCVQAYKVPPQSCVIQPMQPLYTDMPILLISVPLKLAFINVSDLSMPHS